jgi:hypothetical protein
MTGDEVGRQTALLELRRRIGVENDEHHPSRPQARLALRDRPADVPKEVFELLVGLPNVGGDVVGVLERS